MASEPDPERLRALEDRLSQLKEKPNAARTSTAKGFSQGEVAWRMVIELATGIVVGSGIGYGIDKFFETLPIFLVIFTLLGFIAGIRTILGTAREMEKKRVAQAASEDNGAAAAARDEGN